MSVRFWSGLPAAERRVTWAELFFDLVFVAAVAQVGAPLAEHYSFAGIGRYAFLLLVIWWAWNGYAVYATRFDADAGAQRVLTLGQMAAVIFHGRQRRGGARQRLLRRVRGSLRGDAPDPRRPIPARRDHRGSPAPGARARHRLRHRCRDLAGIGAGRAAAPLCLLGSRAQHRHRHGRLRRASHATATAACLAPTRALRAVHADPARRGDRRDDERDPVAADLDGAGGRRQRSAASA